MNPKLPYYMAYPMPLAFDDEKIERRDFEYMKSLYPSMAKKILPYVEDECDRLEYDCSMMYEMCIRDSGNTGAGVEGVKKTVEQAVGSDILFSQG